MDWTSAVGLGLDQGQLVLTWTLDSVFMMDIADWLSQYSVVGDQSGCAISARNMQIHIHSFITCITMMYSASVVDNAMIGCFLELQETMPPLMVNT